MIAVIGAFVAGLIMGVFLMCFLQVNKKGR